ncbi:MAG TPA: N-acetylglucosamine kinase [Flavobacteriia bacterium]|nr:N-acetylglucosamine kinase [Flavobacteriia bacterium]
MILIADSGSTKTNWLAINNKGAQFFNTKTAGLNPAVFELETLKNRILANPELVKNSDKITHLYFYGAGCGTKTPKQKLSNLLTEIFKNAKIAVKEDTEAAVFSVTEKPAIVCILGTGSNCSYFDGKKVHQKVASLGYIVMDDASGNYFGKQLLRDYFFNKMPSDLATEFSKEFNLYPDFIKENLYKRENPNTYLANFVRFLVKNKDGAYAQKMIKEGLNLFIENQVLQYPESKKLPIHFIGSLAHFFKDELKECFQQKNLKLGKIERHPINGLVNYHLKKLK